MNHYTKHKNPKSIKRKRRGGFLSMQLPLTMISTALCRNQIQIIQAQTIMPNYMIAEVENIEFPELDFSEKYKLPMQIEKAKKVLDFIKSKATNQKQLKSVQIFQTI